jgi:hypothetical protein
VFVCFVICCAFAWRNGKNYFVIRKGKFIAMWNNKKSFACNLRLNKKSFKHEKTLICINEAIVSALQSEALQKYKTCKSAETNFMQHKFKSHKSCFNFGLKA